MSLASGHKGRPGSIMDKKIHENPKYRGVTSRLNTGSSLSKYNKKVCPLLLSSLYILSLTIMNNLRQILNFFQIAKKVKR